MSSVFAKTPGWLDWDANRTPPSVELPPGSVDAHCHVFGPGATFPYSPSRKYTPCDASKADLLALHHDLGFDKRVVVQATCHGTDNSALLDVLESHPDTSRGVATVTPAVTTAELQRMHEVGVRGARFNFVKRLVSGTPKEDLTAIAQKIADFGWHIVLYFEAADLAELAPFFDSLPARLVIDHMGRPDVRETVESPGFARFLEFVARNEAWVKVSCPERLTVTGPYAVDHEHKPYRDVVPFARKVLAEFPDSTIWGTDWPHPNLKSHMPDDGCMLNYLAEITDAPDELEALLVANPNNLYWTD